MSAGQNDPQRDFLAERLLFCALALGGNLTVEADRKVLNGLLDTGGDYEGWVTNIHVANTRDGRYVHGVIGIRTIMGMKGCP